MSMFLPMTASAFRLRNCLHLLQWCYLCHFHTVTVLITRLLKVISEQAVLNLLVTIEQPKFAPPPKLPSYGPISKLDYLPYAWPHPTYHPKLCRLNNYSCCKTVVKHSLMKGRKFCIHIMYWIIIFIY